MLALLAVYRIGAHIPTPGIDSEALANFFAQNQGTVFGFLDLFSGGNFRRLTIFALGIMPYITASIILQLLTVVWPYLEKLSKEGELGRRKITTYTRYLTVVLSAVQSAGIAVALQRQGQFVVNPGIGFTLMTMLTLTTGTAFIMWLGEQITDRGIGNVMSWVLPCLRTFGLVVRENRFLSAFTDALRFAEPLYNLLYVLGIIFFCYFYTSIIFNSNEVADNIRKYGGFIPGIRPGKRTADYVNEVLTHITLVGALYLIIISFIPEWMITGIHLNSLPWWLGGTFFDKLPVWMTHGLGVNFYF